MADTQYDKECKCAGESDKEFSQAYRADDVFRTTAFGNEGAGYQRPPATTTEGVEKAAGAGKPAGTFYFLGFHFLFKGINQNAYSQNQRIQGNNRPEPVGIALANEAEQQGAADSPDNAGNEQGFE